MLTTASRYWHTLKHLKPVQFYGRARFRVLPKLDTVTPAPRRRPGPFTWQPPVARPRSRVGVASFDLFGQIHSLPDTGGWDDPAVDKLRRYNLHYFDWLCADAITDDDAVTSALASRWVAENPPTTGTGWEPYPVSLRIVNWIKWLVARDDPHPQLAASLALQARWLKQRLEWHLLGNHLFANAKALIFAGLFFEGAEADAWRATGLAIITSQLNEQQLADGGHFERSPMYHAIFVEDLLDLVNAAESWPTVVATPVVARWRSAAERGLGFLAAMTHPDGEIALFNDAAFGIAPRHEAFAAYADRLGVLYPTPTRVPLVHLRASGYVRVSSGAAVALLDVAPVGPDYLPGHAHADTLSFELSVGGRRFIVNGGTSEYGTGPVRLFERSTAAHSTVEIDGTNSSEVWGGFRVARRARPFGLTIDEGEPLIIACAHDGYTRLPGKPVHRRCWSFTEDGVTIDDHVSGPPRRSVARYILAPEITIASAGKQRWRLDHNDGPSMTIEVLVGEAAIAEAHYSPRFGTRIATHALEVILDDNRASVSLDWS